MSTEREIRPAGTGPDSDSNNRCHECSAIAARLAASPLFPISVPETSDGRQARDSVARTTVDGNTLTITVTDADRTVRRYTAVVQPGGQDD
jgi:hypothetical protein